MLTYQENSSISRLVMRQFDLENRRRERELVRENQRRQSERGIEIQRMRDRDLEPLPILEVDALVEMPDGRMYIAIQDRPIRPRRF